MGRLGGRPGGSWGSLGALWGSSGGPSGSLLGRLEALRERFQDDAASEPSSEPIFRGCPERNGHFPGIRQRGAGWTPRLLVRENEAPEPTVHAGGASRHPRVRLEAVLKAAGPSWGRPGAVLGAVLGALGALRGPSWATGTFCVPLGLSVSRWGFPCPWGPRPWPLRVPTGLSVSPFLRGRL